MTDETPTPDEATRTLAQAWVRAALAEVTMVISLKASMHLSLVSPDDWARACEEAAVDAGLPSADGLLASFAVHLGGGIIAGLGEDGEIVRSFVPGLAGLAGEDAA